LEYVAHHLRSLRTVIIMLLAVPAGKLLEVGNPARAARLALRGVGIGVGVGVAHRIQPDADGQVGRGMDVHVSLGVNVGEIG